MNCGHYQGYNHTDEFILTQHPLEATVGDFWRMVWDNNSSVIVLLSRVDDQVSLDNLHILTTVHRIIFAHCYFHPSLAVP